MIVHYKAGDIQLKPTGENTDSSSVENPRATAEELKTIPVSQIKSHSKFSTSKFWMKPEQQLKGTRFKQLNRWMVLNKDTFVLQAQRRIY